MDVLGLSRKEFRVLGYFQICVGLELVLRGVRAVGVFVVSRFCRFTWVFRYKDFRDIRFAAYSAKPGEGVRGVRGFYGNVV